MKKTSTAVLLSALVYPGAGHLYFKKYLPGVLIIIVASVSLYFIAINIINQAQLIADQILAGNVQFNIVQIKNMLDKQDNSSGLLSVNTFTLILLISWLVGIVDSYRIGRANRNS